MTENVITLINAACRKHFPTFMKKIWPVLELDNPLRELLCHQAIFHRLELVRSGERPRQLIMMPPRNLKSTFISVSWIVWLIAKNMEIEIMNACHTRALAKHLHDQRKRVIESDVFNAIFPEFAANVISFTDSGLKTRQGGAIHPVSFEAAPTGLGQDYLVVDDAHKADDVQSVVKRNAAIRFHSESLLSRANNRPRPREVVVGQRLHRNDLYGRLAQTGEYDVLSLPLVAMERTEIPLAAGNAYVREIGDVLDPSFTPEAIDDIKRIQGEAFFACQYQQAPELAKSHFFEREWFVPTAMPMLMPGDQYVMSWDCGASIDDGASFSVGTIWHVHGKDYTLIEVIRGRFTPEQLALIAREAVTKRRINIVLVENAGWGGAILGAGISNTTAIHPVTVSASKETRAARHVTLIQSGRVRYVQGIEGSESFLDEVSEFPTSTFNDQVDSMTQAFDWLEENVATMQGRRIVGTQPYLTVQHGNYVLAGARPKPPHPMRDPKQPLGPRGWNSRRR